MAANSWLAGVLRHSPCPIHSSIGVYLFYTARSGPLSRVSGKWAYLASSSSDGGDRRKEHTAMSCVAVIDDSVVVRKLVETSMARAGIACLSFRDGYEALRAFRT